jgi:16S rRNA (cytosine967-C5)-methyltransferase
MPKQAMILDQAARLVKPGGRLIYATCSLLDEENEGQVTAFLDRTPAFKRIPLAAPLPAPLHGAALHLTPRTNGTDGFFGVIMERA